MKIAKSVFVKEYFTFHLFREAPWNSVWNRKYDRRVAGNLGEETGYDEPIRYFNKGGLVNLVGEVIE